MGILKNLKEAFEVIKEKEVFESSPTVPTGFEAQAYSKDVAPVKSDYLDEMKGWTGTSVTAIADQLASIKIRLYKYTEDGSEEIVQHDILDLLFKVNDFTTKFDHFWLTQAYLELAGEAPWFIEKKGSKIVNIFFLRPDRLRPIVGDDRLISGYKYKIGNAEEIDLKLEEVIFLKYPNPANPFRGIGTLQMAARTVDIDNYSEEWNKTFYQNSAHPDSILTVDTDQMGDDQKDQLKKSLKSQYQGFKKAHQTMVLFGNMKWENIGFNQKDMDFLEQQKFSRDKILGIFRVPKAIVSQTDGVNFASAKTAENIFAKYTIDPKMERLIQQLNEFLLPQFPGTENMFLDYDSPVPTDKETDAKIFAEGLKNGYYTINEVRQELNLPEVEGGDEIYLPFNLAPLGTERGTQPKTLGYKNKNLKKKALHEDERVREMKARSRVFFKSKDYEEELINKTIKGIKEELKKGIKKAEYNYWSEEKIMAFWVKKDEIARKYDPKIKEKLVKLFRDQRKKTIPKLNKYKDIKQDANAVYNNIKLNIEQEAKTTVGLTINIFEDLFEEGANATFKELDLDTKIDMESEEVKKIIKADSRKMSVAVNETTNEKLKKQVIDGFAKGESIDEIAEKIKNMFVSAEEFRAQMIAKTESIRYNAGATEQAFKDSGIVAKKEWLVNPGACEYCQTMPGKTASLGESFFKEGDSVNGVDGGKLSLDYEQVEHPPLHTNSVWDGTAYVFTPKGNKRLKEVKVNDLVLTHTGKFKKVLATPKMKKIGKKYIIYSNGQRISVTDEHEILTNDGWKRADELNIDNDIQLHYDKCECGNKKIVYKSVCGKDCKYYNKIITDIAHKTLREKGHYKRDNSYLLGENNPAKTERARRINSESKMGDKNPMRKYPEVVKKWRKKMDKFLKENPHKHPNYIMAQRGFISSLERDMKDILNSMGLKYESQYKINKYFADFVLLDRKIVIECDGEYWHQDKEKDKIRQDNIEKEGWTVLRFPEKRKYNKSLVIKQLTNILNNHSGKLKGDFYKIDKIIIRNVKTPQMTYDLTIKDDESFVLNGIAIHNCKCDLVPVLKK